jgi:plasmid stabilization system protein ParE
MTKVDVLPVAQRELRESFGWYRERSARTAKRFAVEVKSAITAIGQDPNQYPRWDDTYRFYMLNRFPYYVAYRQTPESVVIVAVRHAAQDQDAWKGR